MRENVSHITTGRTVPAIFCDPTVPVYAGGVATCSTCGLVLVAGYDCDSCRGES